MFNNSGKPNSCSAPSVVISSSLHSGTQSLKRALSGAAITFAALAALCCPSFAGSQPWEQGGLSGDPKAILQAAQAVPDPKGNDVVVLLDEQYFSIDEQGRTTETKHSVYRVNTTEGVEKWGETGSYWEPWHQERPVVKARVIAADGSIHMLDPKNLTDSPADENSPQTYSDDRRYHGPLPAVAIGAVVEEEIVVRDTAPFFEGGFSNREYFGRGVPVQQRRLVVELPKSMPLHYAVHLLPNATVKKEEVNGRVRLTVEAGPIEAIREDHSNFPTDAPIWPHVDIATGNSWKDISDTYRRDVEAQIRLEELKGFLPSVGKTAARDEVIRATLAKLHKEVRYTGVEFGRSKLVPQSTSEILKRKFGDCKDKATLLVSMLRAQGITAHVALLMSDSGAQDVEPDMPGMGLFDHAIAVVPGTPDLWIDATAEFTPLGELPGVDQGRMALVIREGTEGLQRTPEVKSIENVSVETREFFLAENGPARVVETTEPKGDLARGLRRQFSGKLNDESRKELEDYMRNAYLAEKLTAAEASDGSDTTHPYHLRLEAAKAPRGSTDEESSVVAVPVSNIFQHLPEILRTQQEEDSDKKTELAKETVKPRTADVVLPEAYVQEWHYKITPPAGYQVRALPENKTVAVGPTQLTQEFKSAADNSVTATFRFDTVKKRYTVEEARQIRTAILKMQSSPMLMIAFDNKGYALLREGKIREALAAYRAMTALHPKEGLHRAQLANALLQAGLGEMARNEAKEATRLEPNSAFAYKTLGWILQHDLIGRRFERGFDLEKSVAAYRKAVELDPKDAVVQADLAILLEHDKNGERYSASADLLGAVKEYRDIKAKDKEKTNFDDNLAFALLYAGKFKETRELLTEIGINSNTRRAVYIAALAGESGPQAAIKSSAEISSNDNERAAPLFTAGQILMNMRLYQQAADLMQAGVARQANSPQSLALVDALRKTKRYEELSAPQHPAEALVQKVMITLFTGADAKQMLSLASKNSYADGKTQAEHIAELEKQQRSMRAALKGRDLPYAAITDLALSNLRLTHDDGEGGIYRVTVQALGAKPEHLVVTQEDGSHKLLGGTGKDMAEFGREVLSRVAKGDTGAAKKLLDWAREDSKLGGGDDPLWGSMFPRFWSKGQAADPALMEYAAAALLVDGEQPAQAALPLLKRGLASASGADQTKFQLALAREYGKQENWAELKVASEYLMKAEPQSDRAFNLMTEALKGQQDWKAWEQLAQERLKKTPDDLNTIHSLAYLAVSQKQFEKSRTIIKPLLDNGRGTSNDMNSYTWEALFGDGTKPEDIQIAQQALSLEQNNNFAIMHTLACLYASVGKPKEARELLLQAIKLNSLDEPDSAIWLGLGIVAEQYGEFEAAREAYTRVEKPKSSDSTTSNYALAQTRMKRVEAELKRLGTAAGQ